MPDYNELIRSLRNCSNNRCAPCDCGWFNKYQVDESCKEIIMWKASAAIEALQAELIRICKQLPKRGEWVGVSPTVDTVQCSICGGQLFSAELETPYCPYCGAKMTEVQE